MATKRKLSTNQRPRMRRRMAILIVGSILLASTLLTTVIITLTRTDRSRAKDTEIRVLQLMKDESYVNDFSIDAPILRPEDRPDANKIFYKKIQPVPTPKVSHAR